MVYRSRESHLLSAAQKRDAMRRRIRGGTPVGVRAFDGDEPVGWCSVAPRETYEKLAHSKTMPRVDDAPAWTGLCFFVRVSRRRGGVTHALLSGALEYAATGGARVVEAYPYDTAGITSRHRGHSSIFRTAGFRRTGRRWAATLAPRAGSKA